MKTEKHFVEMAKAWMHAAPELENSKNSPVQAAELAAGSTLCQTDNSSQLQLGSTREFRRT
jgi:hypothetical protein